MIIYEAHRSFLNNEIYKQYDEDLSFGVHLHNSFELITVCEGELSVALDGKEYSLKEGEAILIFPNSIHAYKSGKAKTKLYIFSNKLVNTFYKEIKGKEATSPVFRIDSYLVDELDNSNQSIYRDKSTLYRIIYEFSKNTDFVERNTKRLDNYGKILNYISNHYTESITVKDIAKELGYDHRYLTSLIKKGLGTTFRRLLNEYRILNAQQLLLTENKTISQIAYECGYDSLCSFNRNFKQISGTTPHEYK